MSEAPKPLTDEELTVYRAGDLDFPAAWFPWRASRRLIATIDARDELIQAQRDDKARMRQQMHDMSLASSEKSQEIDELRAKIVEACAGDADARKVTVTRKEVEECLDDATSRFFGHTYKPTVELMRAAIECFAERCGIEIVEAVSQTVKSSPVPPDDSGPLDSRPRRGTSGESLMSELELRAMVLSAVDELIRRIGQLESRIPTITRELIKEITLGYSNPASKAHAVLAIEAVASRLGIEVEE